MTKIFEQLFCHPHNTSTVVEDLSASRSIAKATDEVYFEHTLAYLNCGSRFVREHAHNAAKDSQASLAMRFKDLQNSDEFRNQLFSSFAIVCLNCVFIEASRRQGIFIVD